MRVCFLKKYVVFLGYTPTESKAEKACVLYSLPSFYFPWQRGVVIIRALRWGEKGKVERMEKEGWKIWEIKEKRKEIEVLERDRNIAKILIFEPYTYKIEIEGKVIPFKEEKELSREELEQKALLELFRFKVLSRDIL